MPIQVNTSLTIPDAELQLKFTPSGGPGGQHANKSNTRVDLSWDISSSESVTESQRAKLVERFGEVVRVVVEDERSQLRNRALAEERRGARVATALTPVRKRRATKPTKGSKRRRLDSKKRTSEKKRLRRDPQW